MTALAGEHVFNPNHGDTTSIEDYVMLSDLMGLRAGDLDEESFVGDTMLNDLDEHYQYEARYNHGSQKGKYFEKVRQIARILNESDSWPFPAVEIGGDTLFNGHHRVSAAILVGWDKPIGIARW
jgi:hypothetical protein